MYTERGTGSAPAQSQARLEQEFPAPPSDTPESGLEGAVFSQGRTYIEEPEAPEPARSPKEIAALAVLNHLDSTAETTIGEPAITMLLRRLDTDKESAAREYADRSGPAAEGATVTDIVCDVAGVKWDDIRWEYSASTGGKDGQSDPDAVAAGIIRAAIKNDIRLRELTINSVTNVTLGSQDFREQKRSVSDEYSSLFEKISAPRASDFFQYMFGGFVEGVKNVSKAVGLFLLRSVVTQNLPGFLKQYIPVENNSPSEEHDQATWWTSTVLAGFANAVIGASIIARALPPSSSTEPVSLAAGIGIMAGFTVVGWLLELALRAPLKPLCPGEGTSNYSMFQGGYPGWSLLEIACIPFRIIGAAGRAIAGSAADMKNRIQEEKTSKFRDSGF